MFYKKKNQNTQENSCKFCEILKNNFFTEHLQTTASINWSDLLGGLPAWTMCFRHCENIVFSYI